MTLRQFQCITMLLSGKSPQGCADAGNASATRNGRTPVPSRSTRERRPLAAGLLVLALLTLTQAATATATATAATATPAAPAATAAPVATAASGRQQPVGRQDATVEGVVVHRDGSPAAGVNVSVTGYDNAGFAGLVATLFTLGLACVAEHDLCLSDSTEGGTTTTGADGRYSDSLPDSYVAGTETDTDWVVTAGLPATGDQVVGPRSTFEFEVNIQVEAAPPLPLWEATPSVSVDGWEATASVDGDPPPGTARPAVTLGGIATPGTTATVDLRLLESEGTPAAAAENLVAYATAYADVRVPHANGRTIYHQAISTGAVAVPVPHLVPPSRGAPCTMVMAAGSPAAEESDLCPVTDGSRSFLPSGATSVTVALASPVDVSAVFVAGAPEGTTVEVSGDGSSWSFLTVDSGRTGPTGSFSAGVVVASPDAPTSARFVRVSRAEGLDGLTEVSVWSGPTNRSDRPPTLGSNGRPTGAAATAGGTPTPTPTPTPATSDGGKGNRTGVLLLALVALVLVGVGVGGGIAWSRRSRPS
jgi:hypothetical protein